MGDSFQEWKQHFIDQARGLIPHQKNFYKVVQQRGKGGNQANIQLVSPTKQVVERAKSTLSQPPTVYDPVTGLVQKPGFGTPLKKRKYTKKKKPTEKTKQKGVKKRPTKSKSSKNINKKPQKKTKDSEKKWW